jgi:hypothetical protein
VRQDRQPLAQQPVDLLGPEPITDGLQAFDVGGSSSAAKPLSSAVSPIPALAAYRLALWVPETPHRSRDLLILVK